MWAIDNRTPYKAGKTWGRDKEGRHQWIVAVKATFDIRPDGSTALSEQQDEPLIAPEYHGEPGVSSLRYEADLVAPKPTTDILLNGNAHAPGGRPSTEFAVSMQVGSLRKLLVVKGDRRFIGDSSKASRPPPLPISSTLPEPPSSVTKASISVATHCGIAAASAAYRAASAS